MKESYHWVDISKFIFAICIVVLHSNVISNPDVDYFIQAFLLRLAVPYFFVASGFFLGLKCYNSGIYNGYSKWNAVIKRLIDKLLVFEPIAIVVASIPLIGVCSMGTYLDKMIRHIVFYPYGSLWYVNALIIAMILLIPAIKNNKEKIALAAGVILYLIFLLFNRYNFLLEGTCFNIYVHRILSVVISLRNGVFVGLLFVGFGVIIAKYKNDIVSKRNYAVIALIVSFALLAMESTLIKGYKGIDDSSFYISYIILLPSLFIATITFPYSLKNKTLILRHLSTSTYFLQKITLGILALIGVAGLTRLFMTFAVIAIICLMIYPNKKEPVYSWLT